LTPEYHIGSKTEGFQDITTPDSCVHFLSAALIALVLKLLFYVMTWYLQLVSLKKLKVKFHVGSQS